MPSTTIQPRLYDLAEERAIRDDAGIPSAGTLHDSDAALAGIHEFLIDGIARSVIAVEQRGEPNGITFEDIGRLVTWADSIRETCEALMMSAAQVSVVAHEAFAVAGGGDHGSESRFGELGSPIDRQEFRDVARRYGFDV